MAHIARLCILAALLGCVYAAKVQDDGRESDVMGELRRVVKPQLDPTGKLFTFRRNFRRFDPATSELTYLVYNATRPVDQFVQLNDEEFGVKKVICTPGSITIETATAENMRNLHSKLQNSPTGLVYGGSRWECISSR
jgi:hypothetical protein